MDIFKLNHQELHTGATIGFQNGKIINGLKSKLWIEKYREPSEFKFTSKESARIRDILPEGTIISHVNTPELMIVEDHQLTIDRKKGTSIVTTTGRGFESISENRLIGSNATWTVNVADADYNLVIPSGACEYQAYLLLRDHMLPAYVSNSRDGYSHLQIDYNNVVNHFGTSPLGDRKIGKGTVYDRVLETLAIDDLGIRTLRPYLAEVYGAAPIGEDNSAYIQIHDGVDRRDTIKFTSISGSVTRADFLWSSRNNKNSAIVTGRWIDVRINNLETDYNRRVVMINGSDIDGVYDAPTSGDLTAAAALMFERGRNVLRSKKSVSVVSMELDARLSPYRYRTDYNIGDLVKLETDYDVMTDMRVTEFIESEDENGSASYPTLTVIQ